MQDNDCFFQPCIPDLRRFAGPQYDPANAAALLVLTAKVTESNQKQQPLVVPEWFDQQIALTVDHQGQKINLGYILYSSIQRLIVLAFTGTWNEFLWAKDFDFPQVPATKLNHYVSGMKVHRGIYSLYTEVQDQIWSRLNAWREPCTQVIVTGRSLGGALSNLAALDLSNPATPYDLYNYSIAGPAVGNPVFAERFNQLVPASWRIFNTADIITSLPFPIMKGSLTDKELDMIRQIVLTSNAELSEDAMPIDEKNIFQHVNHNYSFNLNLGDIWKNHQKAYTDVMIGPNAGVYE